MYILKIYGIGIINKPYMVDISLGASTIELKVYGTKFNCKMTQASAKSIKNGLIRF